MLPFARRARRGQGLVELALVLPLCLWILLGIIDFGRAYYYYVAATNAAREGARYWASHPTATVADVQSRVVAEALPQVSIDPSRITLNTPAPDQRQVVVQYAFQPIMPLIASLWGGGALTIVTQATMPVLSS